MESKMPLLPGFWSEQVGGGGAVRSAGAGCWWSRLTTWGMGLASLSSGEKTCFFC